MRVYSWEIVNKMDIATFETRYDMHREKGL